MSLEKILHNYHLNQGWKAAAVQVTLSMGSMRPVTFPLNIHTIAFINRVPVMIRGDRMLQDKDPISVTVAPKNLDEEALASPRHLSLPYVARPREYALGRVDFDRFRKANPSRRKPYLWSPVPWLTIPIEKVTRHRGILLESTAILDLSGYVARNDDSDYDETEEWIRDLIPRPTFLNTPHIKHARDAIQELEDLECFGEIQSPVLWSVELD